MKGILLSKKWWLGVLMGAGIGYTYYHFVGCASGTCAITSHPIYSTIYGAMMGGLLLTAFEKDQQKKHE